MPVIALLTWLELFEPEVRTAQSGKNFSDTFIQKVYSKALPRHGNTSAPSLESLPLEPLPLEPLPRELPLRGNVDVGLLSARHPGLPGYLSIFTHHNHDHPLESVSMYQPKFFREERLDKAIELLRENPLGTMIVTADSGFEVNHIPFVADPVDAESVRLRAHIPRANPLASLLDTEQHCVVIFNGPNGYISPSWYATKKQHGKVVPTWNYSVVHVHGNGIVKDDPEWVLEQLNALTHQNESVRPKTWAVSDAPDDFIASQLQALVGLEIIATQVEAKTKASQNQPSENKHSVLESLNNEQPASALRAMMKTALE